MVYPRNAKNLGIAPVARILACALVSGFVLLVLFLIVHAEEATTSHPSVEIALATSTRPPPDDVGDPASTATSTIQAWISLATPDVITPTTVPSNPVPVSPSIPSPSRVPPTAVPLTIESPTVVHPTPVAPTTVPIVPTDTSISYAPISRLLIPRIGVDTSVETKSLDPGGVMQTPSAPDVASWYDFSSHPVGEGNAVFAGHLDYASYGPAVFWRLGELRPGDVIEVQLQDGTVLPYRVTSVQIFAATDDASNVVASAGRPTITLITCDGAFDSEGRAYDERLVVTGDRID